MRLLFVLVGTPRTVGTPHASDPMERAFTSAIWKESVSGPVWVGTLGIRGDSVGNPKVHGGPDQAVLMYAASHYPAWRAQWGREIGRGCSARISKPREPCATLARRHQVRDMIAIVQANGRGGWYLRVLQGSGIRFPTVPPAWPDAPPSPPTGRRD